MTVNRVESDLFGEKTMTSMIVQRRIDRTKLLYQAARYENMSPDKVRDMGVGHYHNA